MSNKCNVLCNWCWSDIAAVHCSMCNEYFPMFQPHNTMLYYTALFPFSHVVASSGFRIAIYQNMSSYNVRTAQIQIEFQSLKPPPGGGFVSSLKFLTASEHIAFFMLRHTTHQLRQVLSCSAPPSGGTIMLSCFWFPSLIVPASSHNAYLLCLYNQAHLVVTCSSVNQLLTYLQPLLDRPSLWKRFSPILGVSLRFGLWVFAIWFVCFFPSFFWTYFPVDVLSQNLCPPVAASTEPQ